MDVRRETVSASRGRALRRIYAALVTAAACFLLVLLFWPAATPTYLAEAAATAQTRLDAQALSGDVAAWLKSAEVQSAALANLRSIDATLAALTADSVRVSALAGPDEMPRLAISCQSTSRRMAQAMADELARQLCEHYADQRRHDRLSPLTKKEERAAEELRQAKAEEERLQVQLEGLRHAQLTATLASHPPATKAEPMTAAADPRRSELVKSLEALKTERDRLLEIYLPAHPQVQTLLGQISQLEEALRRYLPEPEDLPDPSNRDGRREGRRVLLQWHRQSPANIALTGADEPQPAQSAQSELNMAVRDTQLALGTATHQRQVAEQEVQSLAAERTRLEAESDMQWTAEPAHIVTASGGSAHTQLLAGALAAAAGSAAMVWLSRRAERKGLLTTVAELQASIALPVLGTVPCDESVATAPLPATRTQAAVQQITRCAEVVILTFVVTVLAAAALDRQLLGDFWADPLATMGGLWQRLL